MAVQVAALCDFCPDDRSSGPTGSAELEHSPLISLWRCNSPHHTAHLCLPEDNNQCYCLFTTRLFWLQQGKQVRYGNDAGTSQIKALG